MKQVEWCMAFYAFVLITILEFSVVTTILEFG